MAQVDDYFAAVQQNPSAPAAIGGGGTDLQDPVIAQLASTLGIDYEAAKKIAYQGTHPEVMANLKEQMGRANALRDTAMPEGRDSGRVYTAANPLEFVAAALRRRRGSKQADEVDTGRAEALRNLEESRASTALVTANKDAEQARMLQEYLRGGRQPQAAQPPQPPPAAPGGPQAGPGGPQAAQGIPDLLRRPPPPQPIAGPQRPDYQMSSEEMNILGPNPAGQAASQMLNAPPQMSPVDVTQRAQIPPQQTWAGDNPARQQMMGRLNALKNWQGFAGDRSPYRNR